VCDIQKSIVNRLTCPICKIPLNDWFTKSGQKISRCEHCNLIAVGNTSQDRSHLYEGEDSVFFQDGNENYYMDESNFLSCRSKLDLCLKYCQQGSSLLDVGANFGHFLSLAKGYYQIRGLDVTDQGAKWAKKNLGIEICLTSIYDPPAEWKECFDIVTCWDVIEHLPDPSRAVDQMKNLLKPGGILLLSTPDAGSLIAKLLGRYWHYIDPVQHYCLFTRKCLGKLMQKGEFEIREMTSFGHYYKIRYIMDRLSYLYPGLSKIFALMKRIPSSILNRHIYLNLGDVMGIVVTKTIVS